MRFLSFILLILALLLETSLTTIPLVLTMLICLTVIYKQNFVFIFAFIFGLLLDLILFNQIGMSSILFVIFLFLILMYQRKFEIKTASFVLVSSFLGSFIYLWIFSYHNLIVLQAIAGATTGLLMFILLRKIEEKSKFLISNS